MAKTELPDDCFLAYYLPHEANYADALLRAGTMDRKPHVMICASSRGGGVAWEFRVTEYDLGGTTTKLEMFSDSFDALVQIPDFFEALRKNPPKTVAAVVRLLDGMGAVDETAREMTRH